MRQIVSLRRRRLLDGGRQPAARRIRARAHRASAGRRSASCPPPAATPTTTSSASTAHFSADRCEPSHLSLFRREQGTGRPARAPALPGPDLRRRRQRHQPARGLARARDRRDPARGLGARRRALRALAPARCAGSARASSTFHGAAAADRGPRPAAVEQHRPLLERAGPPRRAVTRWLRDGMRAGLRRRRRRRAALRRRRASRRSSPRARRRAPTGSSCATATW